MKVWIQKIQRLIVKFSCTYPKLYLAAYILGVVALLMVLAFGDISVKAITYPFLYEMEETSGVVMERDKERASVRLKNHRYTIYSYTYIVDDLKIEVNASHMRKYENGDVMPYYRYEGQGKVLGEVYKFTAVKGILILLLNLFSSVHGLFFMLTEVNTSVLSRRKKLENMKPPEKMDYNSMSAKELYALCVKRKLSKSQIKKRDAGYLKQCLRKKDEEEQRGFEHAKETLKKEKSLPVKILIFVACAVLMAGFAVVIRGYWVILM